MRVVNFQIGVNVIGLPEFVQHVVIDKKGKTVNGSNYNGKTIHYVDVKQNLKPCVK